VATCLIAVVVAALAGLAIAVYLAEIVPLRLRSPLSFLVDLLAVVPSVVYGLWGIFVLVPWLRRYVELPLALHAGGFFLFSGSPYGLGFLAAGVLLAIMVTPTVVAISREVLLAVPDDQRNAALALGATRWEMVRDVVVPAARSGIAGAIGLGLGRALGETMAVTMVIGNTPQIAWSLFATGYSMPAVLANEFTEASTSMHLSALMEIALVLFLMTLAVNVAGRLLTREVKA
jgi:phosphate transport system permease protein